MNFKKPNYWDRQIGLISIVLLPITLIVLIVNFLKKKLIKPEKFNIPIICVGNIYIGGTGKTPTSMLLANKLSKLERKPAIIRKYYKSHLDEYNLIKNNAEILITNKSRIEALKKAETNFDIAILDDGLQDYKIKKDISIVCFNHGQLIGNGLVLPSGPLRENLSALKDTDIIIINGPRNKNFENKKLFAIAGIGNPENFFELIEQNNLKIEKKLTFPDHYKFSKPEIQEIVEEAKINNYQIIMTEKDYFKINHYNLDKINYLKVALEIDGIDKLVNRINKI